MKLCLRCHETFAGKSWQCPQCGCAPEERGGFPSFAPEFSSDAGFKDAYFAELVRLEASNFWFRARNRLLLWALERYFPGARSFLEIGCGTGYVLAGVGAACPAMRLSGSEISHAGLAHDAHRVPGASLFQMDARSIPFVEEFDVIGAFDVLEHIEADATVIDQMQRAVRPGGGILLTVPQHAFLWSRVDEYACHVRRYSAADLVRKVEASGFSVERQTSFVALLLPLMLASRLRPPRGPAESDPLSELRIGGALNALLEKVMDVERQTIRAGLNFPFGGSLMLIARKKP